MKNVTFPTGKKALSGGEGGGGRTGDVDEGRGRGGGAPGSRGRERWGNGLQKAERLQGPRGGRQAALGAPAGRPLERGERELRHGESAPVRGDRQRVPQGPGFEQVSRGGRLASCSVRQQLVGSGTPPPSPH